MKVVEELTVDAPPKVVYGLYADITAWPKVLDDVVSAEEVYFDGYNQEFTMTVERPGGEETVRGIRYCRPTALDGSAPESLRTAELEMCQFTTPPMLSKMSGKWTFSGPEQGPTTVVAERHFAMKDPNADEEAFAVNLRGFLKLNLEKFGQAAVDASR